MNSSTCAALASRSMKVETDGASSACISSRSSTSISRGSGGAPGVPTSSMQLGLEAALELAAEGAAAKAPTPSASSTPSKPR